MVAHSAYIVQSQIISLDKLPFLDGKLIHPVFRKMFTSKNCFSDLLTLFLDDKNSHSDLLTLYSDDEDSLNSVILPSKPFICRLGQVYFNLRSLRLEQELPALTGGWLSEYLEDNDQEYIYFIDQIFGYDRTLEDQRMNHLYFELRRPLFLKASFGNQTQADGRIFVHFYPSGFLVIYLVIALKQKQSFNSFSSLHESIKETRPWRSDGRWNWTTKLRSGKLSEIITLVKENIYKSLFLDRPAFIKEDDWHSALKIITYTAPEEVAATFFRGQYELFNLDDYNRAREYLLISKQGLICGMSPSRNRKSALYFFWRILTLFEFVMLKNVIYKNYAEYLRSETINLRDTRLSSTSEVAGKNIARLPTYDSQMPKYLIALDKHIRSTKPFYRRIYSSLSKEIGFDVHREKTVQLIKEWEKEIERREPKYNFYEHVLFINHPENSTIIKGDYFMGDKKVEVLLGDNTTIFGDFVVANSVKDSFNKVTSANVADELKGLLKELSIAVGKMSEKLPKEEGKRAARALETLTDEAISEKPNRQWWSVSVEGLTQAAKNVGQVGKPVLDIIAHLIPLLEQKSG